MKLHRLIITALLTLTYTFSPAVNVAALKGQIVNTVTDFQSKVLPKLINIADAIKSRNVSSIESYLADSSQPVIPQKALKFASENITSIQQRLDQLFSVSIPADVVKFLNSIQPNLGNQLGNLKTLTANALQRIKLQDQFATLANVVSKIKVADVKKVAQDLINKYAANKIDPDKLIDSAKKLAGTLDSLKTAAQNLQEQGILDTLEKLAQTIPAFVKGDESAREDLSDTILGLVNQLNDQGPTAKPFIIAFGDFISQFVPFIDQLYTNFGPIIWAQVPQDQQKEVQDVLSKLKANQGAILNTVNTVRDRIVGLIPSN